MALSYNNKHNLNWNKKKGKVRLPLTIRHLKKKLLKKLCHQKRMASKTWSRQKLKWLITTRRSLRTMNSEPDNTTGNRHFKYTV